MEKHKVKEKNEGIEEFKQAYKSRCRGHKKKTY
jgi:hypothetical protein